MRIHCVGIGGIGLSALAGFCHQRGDDVSGSDVDLSPIAQKLQEQGIPIAVPQKAENIPPDIDLVVYSEAVSPDNPERQAATEQGIPQQSYFQYLGEITQSFRTIAVAGTHGKTTTTGLIGNGFLAAGFDATMFVGSTLPQLEHSNMHVGTNPWCLVEACEYRNNFQYLSPEIVVLTNVDFDHPDAYRSQEAYLETFTSFCHKAKTVIFHAQDAHAQTVLGSFTGEKHTVSWRETDLPSLQIIGDHNRQNAALALKLGQYLQQIEAFSDLPTFTQGLATFSGASRRQEFLGEKGGVKIFDDYGHHPSEIKATLEAFQQAHPHTKVGLIFQPHQYSRTRTFLDAFQQVLRLPDNLGIMDIYEARDTQEDKAAVSAETLITSIPHAEKIETPQDVEAFLKKFRPGDILLFMGAGDISDFARKIFTAKTT